MTRGNSEGPRGSGRASVPVGVERVLYRAAADPGFREQLLREREAAVAAAGVSLLPGEAALLRSIPEGQLLSTIEGLDLSPDNLQRRQFLKAVAVTSATALAAEAVAGCGDDGGTKGIRPDLPQGLDGGADVGGARDAAGSRLEMTLQEGMAGTGIRPDR